MRYLASIVFAFAFATPALAQQSSGVVATGIKPGEVRIVVSYINPNGKLVSDTTQLVVLPPVIANLTLFNQINPARWVSSIQPNKPFCPYAVTRDSVGNIVTGLKVSFVSTDTTVAKITPSSICPDTSVDMSKLNALPLTPPPMSLLTLIRQ